MPDIKKIDQSLIHFFHKYSGAFARISLFVVYFWFGILKILDTSPANPLVASLLEQTLPFLTFRSFIVFFSLYEMLIGILFLFPKSDRLTFILFAAHMLTTFLPLVFLPANTWQSFMVPTLEGQYIIKNLVLIGLAMAIAGNLRPLSKK